MGWLKRIQARIAAAVVIVIAFTVWLKTPNDPVFNGRRLSAHLALLTEFAGISMGFSDGGTEDLCEPRLLGAHNETAEEAIQSVGTNALPLLSRMLGAKRPVINTWLEEFGARHPLLGKHLHFDGSESYRRQMQAATAFRNLGPRAVGAAPDIIKLLDDPSTALCAITSLMYIHPTNTAQILSLTNVFRLPEAGGVGLHTSAMLVLGTFGTNAAGAVPLLFLQLASTNEHSQAAAAVALARIGAPAELVVPAIVRTLPAQLAIRQVPIPGGGLMPVFPETKPLEMKVWALRQYGRRASNAIPTLMRLAENIRMHPLLERIQDATNAVMADVMDSPAVEH